jgi:hypothetical protein
MLNNPFRLGVEDFRNPNEFRIVHEDFFEIRITLIGFFGS